MRFVAGGPHFVKSGHHFVARMVQYPFPMTYGQYFDFAMTQYWSLPRHTASFSCPPTAPWPDLVQAEVDRFREGTRGIVASHI